MRVNGAKADPARGGDQSAARGIEASQTLRNISDKKGAGHHESHQRHPSNPRSQLNWSAQLHRLRCPL